MLVVEDCIELFQKIKTTIQFIHHFQYQWVCLLKRWLIYPFHELSVQQLELEELDWTGRILGYDQRGAIPESTPQIRQQ
jgi:hypothetical protein